MAEYEVIDKSVSERAIAAFDGIKEAIEDMEVPVGNVPVEVYPDKIREISVGGIKIPPRNVSGFAATVGNQRVILKWSDPDDFEVDSTGIMVEWQKTIIVAKPGSYPNDENDGVVVVSNSIRNQYTTDGYIVTGLNNGVTYYFQAFPISTTNAVNRNEENRITATPKEIPTGNVSDFTAIGGYESITLTWSDPIDEFWHSTKIVVKNGDYPANENDGTIVLTSTTRNQYATAGYIHSGLTNGEEYFYQAFPIAADGSVNRDIANRTSATPSRMVIADIPTQSGTLTYNGNAQSPMWENYSSSQLTLGGETSGLNAGIYTATFTPTEQYKWEDGTIEAKSVTWTIGKAAGSLSVSPTSITLNPTTPSGTITVTRLGDGTISAVSSNTSIATVTVSGNTVTVNSVGQTNGTATVTVSVAEGTNHLAPPNQTISVSAEFAPPKPPSFADSTWKQAADVADMIAANGWTAEQVKANIGWEVGNTKAIVGGGVNLTLRIIGFNHDNAVGGGKAGISLQLSPIAWGATTAARIGMEATNTNANGWHGSRMKLTTLPSYKALLPADLQAVIKRVLKPTATSGSNSAIVNSQDDLWLLSEREVFGTNQYSAAGEGERYAYWTANTSATELIHQQPSGTNAGWWLRSPRISNSGDFGVVDNFGSKSPYSASWNNAVSFALCIGNPPPKPDVSRTFSENTWEQISAASTWAELNGLTAAEITNEFGWNVGDIKAVLMNGTNYNLRIIGFMHDDKVGGGKAGITLDMQHSYGTTTADRRYMNSTNTNVGGWTSSYMRQTVMPELLAKLPADLQAAIKSVDKLTSDGNQSSTINTTSNKLFLLSEIEVFGTSSYSYVGEGSRYAYYLANNTYAARIKQQPSGTNHPWWLRSPRSNAAVYFCIVDDGGGIDIDGASRTIGVSFGLCV